MEIQTQKLTKNKLNEGKKKWKRQRENKMKKPTSLNCNYNIYAKLYECNKFFKKYHIYFCLFHLGVRDSQIPKSVTDLYFGPHYLMLIVSTSQLKIKKL